jgi:hypothetical protein
VICFRLRMSVADFVFEPGVQVAASSSAASILLLPSKTRSNTAALVLAAALRYLAR